MKTINQLTKKVIYTRIINITNGFIISVLAAHSLTKLEQGYFFTIISIAAAQILFELGISNLLLHHLSQAHSNRSNAQTDQQKIECEIKLAEIFKYTLKYFNNASLLYIVIIGISGIIFFYTSDKNSNSQWMPTWIVTIIANSISLKNLAGLIYLDSQGKISESYNLRSATLIINILCFIALITIQLGLISYSIAILLGYSYQALRLKRELAPIKKIIRKYKNKTHQIIKPNRDQFKIGISSISGYITVNSIAPYTFHFFGPIKAGQLGLTMSIFSALAAICMARTTAEAPKYGPLIAQHKIKELQTLYKKTFAISVTTATLACGATIILKILSNPLLSENIQERLLGTSEFIIFSILIISNVSLSSTSTVLRAFKKEKIMIPSLICAVIVLISELVLNLAPINCVAVIAIYNGLIFLPFAQKKLHHELHSKPANT